MSRGVLSVIEDAGRVGYGYGYGYGYSSGDGDGSRA